jgi:hypothetical protein
MHLRAYTLVASFCAFFLASAARADIAPFDTCSTAGQSCTNAGPSANQSGVCTKTTCSRPQPNGTSAQFDCFRCFPVDGGTSSSGASGDGGSNSGGSRGGGCAGCSAGSVGARDVDPMALFALGALLLRRRAGRSAGDQSRAGRSAGDALKHRR